MPTDAAALQNADIPGRAAASLKLDAVRRLVALIFDEHPARLCLKPL
jgi:hypothetical protein